MRKFLAQLGFQDPVPNGSFINLPGLNTPSANSNGNLLQTLTQSHRPFKIPYQPPQELAFRELPQELALRVKALAERRLHQAKKDEEKFKTYAPKDDKGQPAYPWPQTKDEWALYEENFKQHQIRSILFEFYDLITEHPNIR
ncbi:MAG: hypothetical protein EA369_05845 [Bradymonadales bacterium]|nr:MAG: hypothetical protein EA369_05845 [Bradymonadales bacterium]